jgi:phosphoadenosine phosphosulfate reductase
MPLIDYTLDGKINKVDIAVKRIRTFDPIATGLFDTPYYVAYSGGKDSDVIRILCELAGVKHDLVHNHTTVDAPETVRYVRSIVKPENISYPEISMWRLIEKKSMPPTRLVRYCCVALKEGGGKDRFVMTGVRWSESFKRKNNRGSIEVLGSSAKTKLILNADNDENRKLFENCTRKGKRILNPIVDWSDADVWEFLNHYNCLSNPLYQEGWKRIGCVGCPMAGQAGMMRGFERWPIYKTNYIKAFDRMVQKRIEDGLPTVWESGQDVFDWWMQDKNFDLQIEGQLMLDEY